jgi:peptidyl-dipeptidase A
MYEDPGQDLNKLWWDLVEKYQLVRRPEGRDAPDFAAKIHVVSAPAYYHNYLMGELFACQVHATIARDILKTEPATALYNGRPEVGMFLKEKVFEPGRSLPWNGLANHATGADLNAKAFAEELKGRSL